MCPRNSPRWYILTATATLLAVECLRGGDASLIKVADSTTCTQIAAEERIPCGVYETRRDNLHGSYDFGAACRSRGCCYEELPPGIESPRPNCFWKGAATPIKIAHLIQSNHFDAGYTDELAAVINSYFDVFFPAAATLAAKLRSLGGEERLRWMTQSWLVALYLNCPQAHLPELHCPLPDEIPKFESAIRQGDIWWHAYPHNAELAVAGAFMVESGLNLTHDLDERFELPFKKTLSQRDVPGITRGAVPILARNGVPYISIGTNNGPYKPIGIPNAFVWKDNTTQSEALVTWHSFGYGSVDDDVGRGKHVNGTGPWEDCQDGQVGCEDGLAEASYLQIPGFDEALILDWRGDNEGPPGCSRLPAQCNVSQGVVEIKADYAAVRKLFPQARVMSSDLDTFMDSLKTKKSILPVVTGELAEGWIYGIASDPIKLQRMRELARARESWVNSDPLKMSAPELAQFTLLSTKNSEHTWGIHNGVVSDSMLESHWDNIAFHKVKQSAENPYAAVERAWRDQRVLGIDAAVASLEGTRFYADLNNRLETLKPLSAPPTGFKPIPLLELSKPVSNFGGWLDLGLDVNNAAITKLCPTLGPNTATWATPEHPLALLRYQTLTESDLVKWRAGFLQPWTITPTMAKDYGKPGLNTTDPNVKHQLAAPQLERVWRRTSPSGDDEILLQSRFNTSLHLEYGSPNTVWTRIISNVAEHTLVVEISMINKTSTRLPEAMFLTFDPPPASSLRWSMQKLRTWMSPDETLDGAAKGLHAVSDSGLRCQIGDDSLTVDSLDAALLHWGAPTPFPNPCLGPVNTTAGASFVLWNNMYNTNYVFWWPFDADSAVIHDSIKYRFRLTLDSK